MGGFPKVSSFGEAFSEPAPVAPAGTRFYKARRSNMYTSEPKMDLPVTSRFKPMDMDPVEAVAVPPAPANSAVSPPPADFTSLQQQQWKERVEKLCNNMTNFMRMQAEELAREPLLHGTQKFLLEDIERLEEEKSELRRRNDELEQKVAGFERERNAWTARFQDLRSRARASAAKSSDADSEAVRTMGNRLEQARAECERLQAERNDVIYQLEQTERTRSATAERLNRMQEAVRFTFDGWFDETKVN
jgi:FtsZ-binding cell division protein ZapB